MDVIGRCVVFSRNPGALRAKQHLSQLREPHYTACSFWSCGGIADVSNSDVLGEMGVGWAPDVPDSPSYTSTEDGLLGVCRVPQHASPPAPPHPGQQRQRNVSRAGVNLHIGADVHIAWVVSERRVPPP